MYRIAPGVGPVELQRTTLTTPQGGKIAVDDTVLHIWQFADGHNLEEIVNHFAAPGLDVRTVRAVVSCLTAAGLLEREEEREPKPRLAPVLGVPVSVIVLGFQGKDWLAECIPSLLAQTYQPVEILVVDNASPEPLGPWLSAAFPQVRVLRLDTPHSFSAANNLGVEASRGSYFLILNQDTYLEPDAITEMVRVLEQNPQCACVAPKLRFTWAPAFLNGIGNRIQPRDWGTDNAIGHLDLGQFDDWTEVPSACFAAALFSRERWQEIGGMDEGFPLYYEDSEWCYRARSLGYSVLAAPKAVVYHALTGRVPSGKPQPLSNSKLRNVVYGRYRFAAKVLGNWRKFLLRYARMDFARFVYCVLRGQWGHAGAYLGAWSRFARDLPQLRQERKALTARRKNDLSDVLSLGERMPGPALWYDLPDLSLASIRNNYLPAIQAGRTRTIPEMTQTISHLHYRPRLLIVSNDVVNEKMGGPGARYMEIAKALCESIEVTLAVPNETSMKAAGFQIVSYREDTPSSLQVLVENNDVALISGYMPAKFPFLEKTATRLVVDLYDPFFLENMYYYLSRPMEEQNRFNQSAVAVTNTLIAQGDFFLCGTERQRDFWLGMMAANERVNPVTFDADPSLRNLIDVLGIGYPTRPVEPRTVARGTIVPEDAKIVLWGGGIWNWLDPITLVKAWSRVLAEHPDARLIFLGTRYPNPIVPEHRIARETIALAEGIGEKDKSIFFIEWLSYPEHQALLREADIGVTFQPEHVEARFSIRTRIIDYFSAELPCLVSEGDVTADWVQAYGVGRVVPTCDAGALASALIEMLSVPKLSYRAAFQRLHPQFEWQSIVAPLRRYCLDGGYAADRERERFSIPKYYGGRVPHSNQTVENALTVLRERGLIAFTGQTLRFIGKAVKSKLRI